MILYTYTAFTQSYIRMYSKIVKYKIQIDADVQPHTYAEQRKIFLCFAHEK